MIHSTIDESDFQYVVVGSQVCDKSTGEVVASVDLLPCPVAPCLIDWRGSLRYTSLECLQAVYRVFYSAYPDFVPGFVLDAWSEERGGVPGAHVRSTGGDPRSLGLSTSNKVCRIKNLSTGEVVEIDKRAARLSRMRRRVFAWANAIKPANDAYDKIMVTLTYKGVDDWKPGHIRAFMLGVRAELGAGLVAYAWCAELQQRGAVHYHVILIVRRGTRLEMPDKSGLWPWGMTKTEKARTVFYICSYMKKAYQKEGDFPKGLRMFAVWVAGGVLGELERWIFRLSSLPRWLCDSIQALGAGVHLLPWVRSPGGGWWFAGKRWRSPFQFVGFA